MTKQNLRGAKLEGATIKEYHRIEKGFALRAPKRPFGLGYEAGLAEMSERLEPTSWVKGDAESSLRALHRWNSDGFRTESIAPIAKICDPPINFAQLEEFFQSRHSIRSFDHAREVPRETIEAAVRLAQRSPSVCNRQASRVHVFYGNSAQRVLSLQTGSKAFAAEVPAVVVVTVDRQHFAGTAERNQPWVDGGLFAMSLVWAFHGIGVATCMLNWSRNNGDSNRLRNTANIPDAEDIVTLIAVGYAAADARAARSRRMPLEQVLRITTG